MRKISIVGTGMAVAGKRVTNDDLSKLVDTNDEWITTRTGIKERRFCDEGESTYTLAETAAREAIARSGISIGDIDAIVCATVSAEYVTPSLSCIVQRQLGLKEDIPVLDVNAACSGFIYGLEVIRGLLDGSDGKYGLVIGCEQLSRLMDMTDRSTCVLFGDGAGAAVVKLSEEKSYASVLGARGGYEIRVEGAGPVVTKIKMDGSEVFKFATAAIPKCIGALQAKTGISLDEVSQIICHQANARILDHCVKKLKADPDKFYKNMDRYGNTSAASVPMALDELVKLGRIHNGDKLMLVGFGGGLTWAGVLIEYDGK
ncbi:3-oxoacyl-ACP synthase III family protein [Butyrivibrio sp. WCD3002]|jgi:3-oxoacyl-[acyl-carrier-protein] synthase-3|uniref:3-oxoacyl-ACP synthase III family protein n=1 Tax=Butyrivibrio sp. WCD3002 TaxID=1280676 RepID=UPI0003FABEF1|nr:beta-ketoacyl-ACP synthase III [Butyrivibrio sp. WCD3002]